MTDNALLDTYDEIDSGGLPDFSALTLPTDSMGLTPMPASAVASAGSAGVGSVLPGILKAGGSILSGIGGYMAGQEQAGADEYNASLALMEGQFQVAQLGEEETQTLSTQKAMYAKAGVEMSGSPLDTAVSTATQFEYSKQVATFNAQSAANMDNYDAQVAKQKGEFALASGLLSGGASLF